MKILFTILISAIALFAQEAFITPQELTKQLHNPKTIILDTTDKETYSKGHIPNAQQVEISAFRHWVNNEYLLMNSPKQIEDIAQRLGIDQDSYVILYGHNKPKELLKASYIALALIVNGFENISILDGGYKAWKENFGNVENMISTKTPRFVKGNFTANYNPDVLVNMDYVKENIGKVAMIEARPKKFYDGTAASQGVKRLGHISGAQSSNWQKKFTESEKLLADKELKHIFYDEHKLNQEKTVVTYCTGGLEASMNWYILTQYLKFKDVKLYDASMKEWGNRTYTPMEK